MNMNLIYDNVHDIEGVKAPKNHINHSINT
jgi:hypothetical protein